MKIQFTFKSPDAVDRAIAESLDSFNISVELEEDFEEDLRDDLRSWFKYGEYVTVEFDTDTKTMSVVRV
jgi:hypothetical protein